MDWEQKRVIFRIYMINKVGTIVAKPHDIASVSNEANKRNAFLTRRFFKLHINKVRSDRYNRQKRFKMDHLSTGRAIWFQCDFTFQKKKQKENKGGGEWWIVIVETCFTFSSVYSVHFIYQQTQIKIVSCVFQRLKRVARGVLVANPVELVFIEHSRRRYATRTEFWLEIVPRVARESSLCNSHKCLSVLRPIQKSYA